jgi:type VI secretion system secreted protein VgrG
MSLSQLAIVADVPCTVRHFSIEEPISSPFLVSVTARSEDPSLDLSTIVGKPAAFTVVTGYAFALFGGVRRWTGICNQARQVRAETNGLSTYEFTIVPSVWLLTQRRNHRIFQHLSVPDIVEKILGEWGVERAWSIERASHPKLEYKVQYGESDYAFVSRLLEEAGIAYTFAEDEKKGSVMVLGDALHKAEPRSPMPLHYVDEANQASEMEFVSGVQLGERVRPGAHVIQDYDLRRPELSLIGNATIAKPPEERYEQFHYRPGALLVEGAKAGDTPAADDRGVARHDKRHGDRTAEGTLLGTRMGRESIAFHTNAVDLRPGTVFSIGNHPHPKLDPARKLLVTDFTLSGAVGEEWSMSGHAAFAEVPYRPPARTKKPEIRSFQSAIVVGPKGDEIHTDEFGRVRVQFHWDREGQANDGSSCWIRVSQGWAGRGYGMQLLPRIGQEVLVAFLDGNPDQPVVIGRVFNQTNPAPYKLPENKTISTWKSDSSPGSGGFNEVKFEDKKGDELLYIQAEKNQRALVKRNETITVLRHRDKDVKHNETDTTGLVRIEVTGLNRSEKTGANRTTIIGGQRQKLTRKNEVERTEQNRKERVGKDKDAVVKAHRRARVEQDGELTVNGNRRQRIGKSQSLTVGTDQQERVVGSHAIAAGKEIHLKAGRDMVGEAKDVTVRGPGGFIRIDAGGVTIRGTVVNINVSGSPGKGRGSKPVLPDKAKEPGKLAMAVARGGFGPAAGLPKLLAPIGSPSIASLLKGGAAFLPKSPTGFFLQLPFGGGLASKIVGGIAAAAIFAYGVSPQVRKLFNDIGKWAKYAVEGGLHWLFSGGWNALGPRECSPKGDNPKPRVAQLASTDDDTLEKAANGSDVTSCVGPLFEAFRPIIHQDPEDAYPVGMEELLAHSIVRDRASKDAVSNQPMGIDAYHALLYDGTAGGKTPPSYGTAIASPSYFLDIDDAFARRRGPGNAIVYGRATKEGKDRIKLQFAMIRAGSYLPNEPGPYDYFEHEGDGESAFVYLKRPDGKASNEWHLYKANYGGHSKTISCCACCLGLPPDGTPHIYVAKGAHATAPVGERRKAGGFALDVFDETPLSYTLRTPGPNTSEHRVVFTNRSMWGDPHWLSSDGAMLGTNSYGGYGEVTAFEGDQGDWTNDDGCDC